MSELKKRILVTNNDRVAGKWGGSVNHIFMVDTYEEVLKRTKDLVHTGHKLLIHPQASSLKPNQTSYKTTLLYGVQRSGKAEDVCLTENALETYERRNPIKEIPKYDEKMAYDHKIIDLSMIESVIPRL